MEVESCTGADHEPIDSLAEEFLERYRRGERPSITEYVSQHPDLAGEIRELFPTLAVLERLGPRPDEISGRAAEAAIGGVIPTQLGEYRLLREVGRGGMGIVYEAEQLSLGRRVALKVLPSHFVLSSSLLTRFQNEARAAARLHHTNIVPVFGVGEDQGIYYYAMQFIQGQGLDVVLDELRALRQQAPLQDPAAKGASSDQAAVQPLSQVIATNSMTGQLAASTLPLAEHEVERGAAIDESRDILSQSGASDLSNHPTSDGTYFRSVARMGLQVAEALAHAHSQGVLHRDIKPSNLLLDAHRTVWVTDFGLAKQEGSDLTHSGDVVGTLRYLAPERFRGTSDARTDIYGLGVTLYELLTMRPAFTTTDRPRLIHEIAHDDPLPPRRLEQRVPRDLETIVLKAMAKEPARRYATADDLAADLRRFLDDQPIAARRTRVVERMWRWCARRPALASLAAALLVSLSVGIAGVCWQWARAETNLKEAVKQEAEAVKMLGIAKVQRQRAEQSLVEVGRQEAIAKREAVRAEGNYQTARSSVNELLTVVSEGDLVNEPGLQPVRLKLLTKAIAFHERMLADRDRDPVARRDLAMAHFRLGILKGQMGPASDEFESYGRAIDLLESADPGDRESAILLTKVYNNFAKKQVDLGQVALAQEALSKARVKIDGVLARAPGDLAAQQALALTFNNAAYALSESRHLDESRNEEALRIHQQALDIYRRAAEKRPDDVNLKHHISTTLSNMARRHATLHRLDEAQQILTECLEIRLEIFRRQPQSLYVQSEVAKVHNARGDVVLWNRAIRDRHDVAQAADSYAQALAIQERLALENPDVYAYRAEVAGTLENLSRLYRQESDWEKALQWRRRELAALAACLELEPENTKLRAQRAIQWEGQATLESQLGLLAESLATRRAVREAWRPILQQPVEVWQPHRTSILNNLAWLMFELGMQDEPVEMYEVALERRELLDGSASDLLGLSADLQRSALAATRAAVLDPQAQEVTARCHEMAVALFRQGAQIAPREAAALASRRAHMRRFATLLTYDADLAKTPDDGNKLHLRGRILQLVGDSIGAQADMERAVQLLDAQLSEAPDNRQTWRVRAVTHFDLGHWEEAIADSTRAMALRANDVTMHAIRGRACLQLGRWQQAHDDLKRATTLQPDRFDIWPQRCRAAYEAGRVDEAQADAARLVELAGDNVQQAETMIWGLLVDRQVPRFPDASLAVAETCDELATQGTHRRPLGGVLFQLGRYQEAVDALLVDETGGPGETASFAAFWLAMSYHHLGKPELARQMFQTGVRSWRGAQTLTPSRGEYLRATWQEARTLLFGSETPAARS
jgi:serine/threonine protein kinase/tetratricopeptide (TPR) repeat protein